MVEKGVYHFVVMQFARTLTSHWAEITSRAL